MRIITETNRLTLREFSVYDAEIFFHLNSDPEVMKYTGDVPFQSISDAEKFFNNYTDYQLNGFGRWAVVLKETGKFIGWCGLKLNEENLIDIGFRFFRKEWNKGYATESAMACLQHGFNNLNIKEIIGRAAKENTASIKVLEKLGMEFWKIGDCDGIKNSVHYKITKDNFINSKKGTTTLL